MASATDPPDIGDSGPTNMIDGQSTGRLFPSWGDTNDNLGKLTMLRMEAVTGSLPKDPFLLRKSVETFLGVKIDGAHPEGRGISYALKVRNDKMANKLLGMKELIGGQQIKISEHPTLNTSRCVVTCSDVIDHPDEKLKADLASQGIKDLRRITRRVGNERTNTATIILTIAGTVIPPNVDFGWIRCKTRPYYPSPMLCYNCWNFGHTRVRCQQTEPTCGTCSGPHANDRENPCTYPAFCRRCKLVNHSLSSRKCPEYIQEEEIQHIRVDMGIS